MADRTMSIDGADSEQISLLVGGVASSVAASEVLYYLYYACCNILLMSKIASAVQQRLLVTNIVSCQVLAMAVAVACAMGWEHTFEVFGKPRSLLLLLGTLLAGGV
eukprot:SAG31_NODE_21303_length_553_cov_0.568282_1_plen_105_part_01